MRVERRGVGAGALLDAERDERRAPLSSAASSSSSFSSGKGDTEARPAAEGMRAEPRVAPSFFAAVARSRCEWSR